MKALSSDSKHLRWTSHGKFCIDGQTICFSKCQNDKTAYLVVSWRHNKGIARHTGKISRHYFWCVSRTCENSVLVTGRYALSVSFPEPVRMFCSNSPVIKPLYQVGHLHSREASPTRPMIVHTEKARGWMQARALG
jgi:hypothetical protein